MALSEGNARSLKSKEPAQAPQGHKYPGGKTSGFLRTPPSAKEEASTHTGDGTEHGQSWQEDNQQTQRCCQDQASPEDLPPGVRRRLAGGGHMGAMDADMQLSVA